MQGKTNVPPPSSRLIPFYSFSSSLYMERVDTGTTPPPPLILRLIITPLRCGVEIVNPARRSIDIPLAQEDGDRDFPAIIKHYFELNPNQRPRKGIEKLDAEILVNRDAVFVFDEEKPDGRHKQTAYFYDETKGGGKN